MEFQLMLNEVGKALTTEDVKALVFLCTDLTKKNLSAVDSPRALFTILGNEDLLTPERQYLLTELLTAIHRPRLVRDCHLPEYVPECERCISAYRKMLIGLSDNITDDDLKSMKFLLSQNLKRKKLEENVTTLELFLEMERAELLSDTNLDVLEQIVTASSPVLKNSIDSFRAQCAQETVDGQLHQSASTQSFASPEDLEQCPRMERRESVELPPFGFAVDDSRDSSGFEEVSEGMSSMSMGASSCEYLTDAQPLMQSAENQSSCEKEPIKPELSQTASPSLQELLTYPMTNKKRGVCMIVSNDDFSQYSELSNRNGTHADENSLELVFKWLGFDVETHKDCTADEILSRFEELSGRDHREMDCVVCCILSHGKRGVVYGVDGKTVSISTLREPFHGQNCSTLAGKPKMFFIQACQGSITQMAVPVQNYSSESESLDSDSVPVCIPDQADFLVAKATVTGYKSFRHVTKGTWFIQPLCRNLIQLVPSGVDVLSILTKVNADVSEMTDPDRNKKQMPQLDSTLRKKVVFPVPAGNPPSLPP